MLYDTAVEMMAHFNRNTKTNNLWHKMKQNGIAVKKLKKREILSCIYPPTLNTKHSVSSNLGTSLNQT